MSYEVNGTTVAADKNGYLENREDWSEEVAKVIAEAEGIAELTERHWDVMNYLREEYFDNRETQPNTRTIIKAMSEAWGEKVKQNVLYDLFPLDPSKQGAKIAGLPESRRKGGY